MSFLAYRTHVYEMYLTPTFLFHFIILTNPIDENMSQAKPRQESNLKLMQRFSVIVALQATSPQDSCSNLAQNGVYNPTLCQKKARFCWCWVHYIKIPTGREVMTTNFLLSGRRVCQHSITNSAKHSINMSIKICLMQSSVYAKGQTKATES